VPQQKEAVGKTNGRTGGQTRSSGRQRHMRMRKQLKRAKRATTTTTTLTQGEQQQQKKKQKFYGKEPGAKTAHTKERKFM